MFLFKWIRRGIFFLILAGVALTAVAAGGCGKYVPADSPTIDITDAGSSDTGDSDTGSGSGEQSGSDSGTSSGEQSGSGSGSGSGSSSGEQSGSGSGSTATGSYVSTSLTVTNLLSSTVYFAYDGELNSVRVQAYGVSTDGTCLYINQTGYGDYDFAAGTSYKLTVSGSGLSNSVGCFNQQLQRVIDSFTIQSGTVEFTLTMPAAYIMIPLDSSGSTVNIDCTVTLTKV